MAIIFIEPDGSQNRLEIVDSPYPDIPTGEWSLDADSAQFSGRIETLAYEKGIRALEIGQEEEDIYWHRMAQGGEGIQEIDLTLEATIHVMMRGTRGAA